MKVIKEGTVTITPEGEVHITDFHVSEMTSDELSVLVEDRVLLAASKIQQSRERRKAVA